MVDQEEEEGRRTDDELVNLKLLHGVGGGGLSVSLFTASASQEIMTRASSIPFRRR